MFTAAGFADLKFTEAETTENQEETGFIPRNISTRGEETKADAGVNKK